MKKNQGKHCYHCRIVNGRLKLKTHQNFMSHTLVKDLIKKIYAPKQSSVFKREEIDCFLISAPESSEYKAIKLVALIGINGAIRLSQRTNLNQGDVTFLSNGTTCLQVKTSKTDPAGRGHSFIITPNPNKKLCAVIQLKNT